MDSTKWFQVHKFGIVLTEEHSLAGFIVKDFFRKRIYSKETIAKKSERIKIKNGYVRKEKIDGVEHIFVDLDEGVTENVLSPEEAVRKYGQII